MDTERARSQVAAQAGAEPVGTYRFGDSPALADELLGLVLHGAKRATAFAAADAAPEGVPFPEAGQVWLLADGSGGVRAAARVEEARVGPLYTVDAAFAWESGWGDRTRAAWLAAHEAYLRRQGFDDVEGEPVLFVRFSVAWPEPDSPRWWLPDVRELRGHEPAPDGPRPDLPALAAFDGERITGLLRFDPQPADLRLVSVTGDEAVQATLRHAFALRRQAERALR